MQDCYAGDVGDYGKYGLLRAVTENGLLLAVNWYKVIPAEPSKQDDGKHTGYLDNPKLYRAYDPNLFDALDSIVNLDRDRSIDAVERASLFPATFFHDEVSKKRGDWHRRALEATEGADVVFLDPDNGLESRIMHERGTGTEKHVKWDELRDYYIRGQSVILYQHRPQMMRKELCIQSTLEFDRAFLCADRTVVLDYPKGTNRFYFMFIHEKHSNCFDRVRSQISSRWAGFCTEVENGVHR